MHGRNTGRDGPGLGHLVEWSPAEADSDPVDSTVSLRLQCIESYPERSGVADCSYYMRTGFCGFGCRCRYHHPRDRSDVAAVLTSEGYPERPSEPPCNYYFKTGTCKFGMSCKFDHLKHTGGSASPVPLNFRGYPLRPGEKECSYYLKMGQCKFGKTCKFHHPTPAALSVAASAPSFYPMVQSPPVPPVKQYGGSSTKRRVARPPLLPCSYTPRAYGPLLLPSGAVRVLNWGAPYSTTVNPAIEAAVLYGVPVVEAPYSPFSYPAGPSSSSQKGAMFPENPGELECWYYLRTGDCKFGLNCRFHHRLQYSGPQMDFGWSPIGLPFHPWGCLG